MFRINTLELYTFIVKILEKKKLYITLKPRQNYSNKGILNQMPLNLYNFINKQWNSSNSNKKET